MRAIAAQLKCDRATVKRVLNENDLDVRGALEQRALNTLNCDVPLTAALRQLLAGLLLGDGGISHCPGKTSRFEMTGKSEEYVRYVAGALQSHGVRVSVALSANGYWRMWSRAWHSLDAFSPDWYGEGTRKHVVPVNLELDPVTVLHWYLGDGGLAKRKGKRPTGYLYTNSFNEENVRNLAALLTDLSIPALALRCGGPQAHEWRIHLNREGILALLAYIGPCPVAAYAYKWDVDTVHARHHPDGRMVKLKKRDFPIPV